MPPFTKRANEIFSPVDAAGHQRSVQNGEVQTWGSEVERLLGEVGDDVDAKVDAVRQEIEQDLQAEAQARVDAVAELEATDAGLSARIDAVQGAQRKQPVVAATTANGNLANDFENGDTIDGVVLATGDRILIKNQTSAAENGVFTVNSSGAPTRAEDADSEGELLGASVYVLGGTANAGKTFGLATQAPITVGTTPLVFVQTGGDPTGLAGQVSSVSGEIATARGGRASLSDRLNSIIRLQNIGITGTPASGFPYSASTFVLNEQTQRAGYINRIVGYGLAAGSIPVKIFARNGDTFVQQGPDYTITFPAGLFSIDVAIPFTASKYIGFYHNVAGGQMIGRLDAASPGIFAAAGNVSTFTDATVDTANYPQLRFETVQSDDNSYLSIRFASASADISAASAAARAAYQLQSFGPSTPSPAAPFATATPYVWATPVLHDSVLGQVTGIGVSPSASARSFMLRRYAERNGVLYEIPHAELIIDNVPVGPFSFSGADLGEFAPKKGEYVGFFPGAGIVIGRTVNLSGQAPIFVGTTGFVPGSNAVSMSSPVTNFRPELRVDLVAVHSSGKANDGEVAYQAAKNAAQVQGEAILRRIGQDRKWYWLDMMDETSLFRDVDGARPVLEAGHPVRLISDKSGNGYDFSASTTFGAWTGSVAEHPGVVFDGSTVKYTASRLDLTNGAEAVTVFAVVTQKKTDNASIVGHSTGASAAQARVYLRTKEAGVRQADAGALVQPVIWEPASDHQQLRILELGVDFAGGRADVLMDFASSIDGSASMATGTATASNEAAASLGQFSAYPYFAGVIHEIIAIAGSLSQRDRVAINRYLAAKYVKRFQIASPARVASELDGAWTWYTDPRVLALSSSKAIVGANTSRGSVAAAIYDFAASFDPVAKHVYSSLYQANDHGSPAFVECASGHVIAFWCKHNGPDYWMSKTTVVGDLSSFGTPVDISSQISPSGALHAYSNPIMLSGESGRIYNFIRVNDGIVWSFAVTWSDDEGATWTALKPIFNSTARPYMKFRRNGTNRIDIITNDAHPNPTPGNKTYHFYMQGGNFYESDGTLIGAVADLPLSAPSVGTVAFDPTAYPDRRSWVFDLTLDGSGRPVATMGVYDSNFVRHEYWQARWNGTAWTHAKVCDAGGPLGNQDAVSYSGLAITHPEDPNVVYSSRQLLNNGQPSPNGPQWHLCKSVSEDDGATWSTTWLNGMPKEFMPGRQQIRPYIAEGMPNRLWYLEGAYTHWAGRYETVVRWVDI